MELKKHPAVIWSQVETFPLTLAIIFFKQKYENFAIYIENVNCNSLLLQEGGGRSSAGRQAAAKAPPTTLRG